MSMIAYATILITFMFGALLLIRIKYLHKKCKNNNNDYFEMDA